ncbi:TetR family transcriptional regulator [Actinomycetes bacterium KLBMP 9797]
MTSHVAPPTTGATDTRATDTRATDTRQRLIEIAVRLFTQHSFAGTSLQMIADELGVTKAAVYHHFRTREDLLNAVVEPIIAEMWRTIHDAEAQRSRHARADRVLTGFIDLAVRNRSLISVLASDPAVIAMARTSREELVARQLALLAEVQPGPAGRVRAAMVMAGVAGVVGPNAAGVDDDALREHLIDAGRRTLGIRPPRRADESPRP